MNNTVRTLINTLESYYHLVSFNKPLFDNYPTNDLHFGFICPGAVKTINYLKNSPINKNLLAFIIKFTDALFFLEIIVIYKDYIDESLYKTMLPIIKNNHCSISNKLTKSISKFFNLIPKNINKNIPDNFYHIRHNTLICSNDKNLANNRIKLLQSIYETFSTQCDGKRNGVSGCRNCCKTNTKCISSCMKF